MYKKQRIATSGAKIILFTILDLRFLGITVETPKFQKTDSFLLNIFCIQEMVAKT